MFNNFEWRGYPPPPLSVGSMPKLQTGGLGYTEQPKGLLFIDSVASEFISPPPSSLSCFRPVAVSRDGLLSIRPEPVTLRLLKAPYPAHSLLMSIR